MRVCLIMEGSYPYITGGVSAWVHDLIRGLPDIDFCIFSLSPESDQELRYELPPNVVEHRDVVITETPRRTKRPRNRKALMEAVGSFHHGAFAGGTPDLTKLIEHLDEGVYLHRLAVEDNTGWELITESNRTHNPLYPFADYFWAWKSAHDMLFTVLGATPPDADVYHAVSTGFAGLAATAARIRRKRPFLLTEHGLYHKERDMEIRKTQFIRGYQRDMWTHLYNAFSRLAYRHADLTVTLFEANRRLEIEMGCPPERAIVVPNGIDVERFTAVERTEKEHFSVGLVGRVVPIKDIKTYIATAKTVLDRIPTARFYCIGPTDEDPAYHDECTALTARLGIDDRFIFTGRQNVLDYYAFIDVLLLTSVREAQPLVILEAYCAGVPAVATRVGNVPELLDYDDRFIASPKDSDGLAEAIIYIHDHPEEMQELVARNRQRALRFYDKKQLHQRYGDLYRQLATPDAEPAAPQPPLDQSGAGAPAGQTDQPAPAPEPATGET